jgi:hypothetical protein
MVVMGFGHVVRSSVQWAARVGSSTGIAGRKAGCAAKFKAAGDLPLSGSIGLAIRIVGCQAQQVKLVVNRVAGCCRRTRQWRAICSDMILRLQHRH